MGFASDTFVQTTWRGNGIMTTVAASVAILAIAFLARTRFPGVVVIASLVVCGAPLGLGAAWIEADHLSGDASLGAQRIAAVVLLAVLTPLHVRVVLGPLGKKA